MAPCLLTDEERRGVLLDVSDDSTWNTRLAVLYRGTSYLRGKQRLPLLVLGHRVMTLQGALNEYSCALFNVKLPPLQGLSRGYSHWQEIECH